MVLKLRKGAAKSEQPLVAGAVNDRPATNGLAAHGTYATKGPTGEKPHTGLVGYLLGKKGPTGYGSRSTAEQVVAKWDGTGKTCIVTGGNTGLGKESAMALASKGCEVILAVRDLARGQAAAKDITAKHPKAKVSVMELDLSSLASVRAFATAFKQSQRPLHVLMCNAGVMATQFTLSADRHELQFATNHLGHFLLVNLLLDVLIASAQATGVNSRVVILSSEAHFSPYKPAQGGPVRFDKLDAKEGYNQWAAYGQSKLCNVLHARELHKGLTAHNVPVTVVACHPGVIPTELFRHVKMNPFLKTLLGLALGWSFKNVAQGAATQTFLATADGVLGGEYYADCNLSPSTKASHDETLGQRLWEVSETLTDA